MNGYDSKMTASLFWRLIPVQMLLIVISGINSILDGIFASNFISVDAMAAIGLFMPVLKMLDMINALLVGGSQLLCGRFLGANMTKRTKGVFTLDIITAAAAAVVLTLALELLTGQAASLLKAQGAVKDDLMKYIRGFSVGIFPFLVGTQLTSFLQLEKQEKRTYTALITMFASNCILNFLFVYVLKMGFLGLGLSTGIGNWIFCAILSSYYFRGRPMISFDISSLALSDLPQLIVSGVPTAIMHLSQFFRGLALNSIILDNVGEVGISAFSAVQTFGNIYWAAPAGVTAAVMILANACAGEEDKEGLVRLFKVFVTRGITFVTVLSLVFIVLSVPLTNIYYHDPSSEVYRMTLRGFMLFPLSTPLSALYVGQAFFLNSLGRRTAVNLLNFSDGFVGVVILSLILVPALGMNGVWAAQIGNGLVTFAVIIMIAVVCRKHFPRTVTDLLTVPDDFGVSDDKRITISIHDMDKVMSVSRDVEYFCLANGIDERRAKFSALCVEEMAGNIVTHGFSDGKPHSIDMRISCIRDDLVICIKDNCIPFDPAETAELFDPEDICRNIGLRLISRISKEISYRNTLGLNILTIIV